MDGVLGRRRRLRLTGIFGLGLFLGTAVGWISPICAAQNAAPKPTLNITAYTIDAEIRPGDHTLDATTQVTFTPLENLPTAIFDLHGALRVDKVTDASGATLNGERGPNATLVVTPSTPLTQGQAVTWTFHYSGELQNGDGGPVEGLKLAYVGDPITYLLYAARWFPMTGYMTDRFTAEIHIKVPAGYRVIGSGSQGKPKPAGKGEEEWDFRWDRPGFPGTIIAGKFDPPVSGAAPNIHVYVTAAHKAAAADYAGTALREFAYFTSTFGIPESTQLNVVELPDDTVPSFWAPEIAAVAGSHIGGRSDFRLLANTIAHQWWGSQVSPATLNDAWITNGMSRYAELMYLEDDAGASALKAAVQDVSAGALAYDTIPLSSAGTQPAYSPQFQSMTLEKGALIFHMLRWEVGEDSFDKILRAVNTEYKDKGIKTAEFERLAEAQSQQALTPFFAEWLDGTGAPQFTDKYAVYRLGNNKGFRTIGEIQGDMDLFNMPVDLRVETEGKTVDKRVDVVGTDSQYVIDTFGRPRRVIIDPDDWVLKTTPDLDVRVAILRGQQLAAQGDSAGALAEYQKALKSNPQSSLASYRIGELLFTMRNYQAAVNSYRDCLNGDDEPKWTEVWSHIAIGKIFDMTGQRDRAIQEYRQALQTNDNTAGALNEARHWIQTPYKRPEAD
ncbi:MAG TPA: M1 family aminopeptidase [Acidobacteriaceae bacterium]|jgi:aminopeptidase N|nr:M1 family aminopeptidase [Acidobacteriaceae bacterium]